MSSARLPLGYNSHQLVVMYFGWQVYCMHPTLVRASVAPKLLVWGCVMLVNGKALLASILLFAVWR